MLFHKGEPGNQLYGVLSGRLRVSAASKDGKEMVIGFQDPGDVIGEIALLDQNPRSATISAVEPTELLTLDRRELLPFLQRHPKVAIHLAQVLAAKLRRLTEITEDAMFLTLPTRLAKKLMGLAKAYGKPAGDGGQLQLKLQQQELADMVGTSRESVNKQLRTWVGEGLVAVERGKVTIVDPDGLEAVAVFDLS